MLRRLGIRVALLLRPDAMRLKPGRHTMTTWTPDPSFYPSPRMAMEAPPETLAYVAMLSADAGRPDALGIVDVDPRSSGYGQLVGQVDMPHPGDELHHFGWNACSSALCPYAPHPHIERRYLNVPCIPSSPLHKKHKKNSFYCDKPPLFYPVVWF
jgi:hypothetical protein